MTDEASDFRVVRLPVVADNDFRCFTCRYWAPAWHETPILRGYCTLPKFGKAEIYTGFVINTAVGPVTERETCCSGWARRK